MTRRDSKQPHAAQPSLPSFPPQNQPAAARPISLPLCDNGSFSAPCRHAMGVRCGLISRNETTKRNTTPKADSPEVCDIAGNFDAGQCRCQIGANFSPVVG